MSHLGPSLRRKRQPSRAWQRLVVSLLVSLLANAMTLWLIRVDWPAVKLGAGEVRPVSLAPLSGAEWAANRAIRPQPAEPPPPPPKAKPEPERHPVGQVVDIAPTGKKEAPEKARFLGERDNKVEKETRSRYARAGFEKTLPVPAQPSPSLAPPQPAQAAGARQAEAAGADARKPGAPGKPGAPPREKLAMVQPEGEVGPARRREAPAPVPGPTGEQGQEGQGGTQPPRSAPRLAPSADFYDKLRGGPAPDHLEDVDVGEGTYLNTREWKYASYFNRIKQAVAMQWDPNTALRSRDPTGERFLYKDRVTWLMITLGPDGVLTDAHVARTSGVDFLDRAAIEAFQKAQPFVNPPRGLADSSGAIKFTFGFYLEVGSPGIRLFRGPAVPQ